MSMMFLDLGCILLLFRSTSIVYLCGTGRMPSAIASASLIALSRSTLMSVISRRDAVCVSGHMYGRSPISLNCSVCSV